MTVAVVMGPSAGHGALEPVRIERRRPHIEAVTARLLRRPLRRFDADRLPPSPASSEKERAGPASDVEDAARPDDPFDLGEVAPRRGNTPRLLADGDGVFGVFVLLDCGRLLDEAVPARTTPEDTAGGLSV